MMLMTTWIVLFGLWDLPSSGLNPPLAPIVASQALPAGVEGPRESPSAASPTDSAAVRPPRRGTGLIIAGSLGLAVGVPILGFIVGTAASSRCSNGGGEQCWGTSGVATLLPVGLVTFLAGMPMLGVGLARREAWKDWQRARGVALRARVTGSREAFTMGLALSF